MPHLSGYRDVGLDQGNRQLTETVRARLRFFQSLLILVAAAVFLTACQTADTLEINPSYATAQPERFAAVVVDGRTGKILYKANENAIRYPASLTKMMTLYLLFEALESGQVTKSTLIPISARAASQAPSKIGLKAGQTIDVDTAIRAICVKSANDIAVAIAEMLGGTEEQFAVRMTSKARALGMNSTTFRNASGLHDPGQVTSAMDMARLGLSLRKNFPQQFSYFSLRQFNFAGRTVTGHNKVLDMVAGANGIKTGYTKASGFNLVTSVERNGKLIVAVIMGEDSARVRDARMTMLVRANSGG
jgi:D-alanyl-D-alanine carboxypeptidase